MHNLAGTLQSKDSPEPQNVAGPPPRRGGIKFLYPSGSQPLTGYTIKRGIGIGGFGEVYYATSAAGKEVALKRIQRNLDVELRGVKQCLNLKHPNLVALYDIRYDDEDQAWVVMEYMAGESLQDVVERNPNGMPVDQVRQWFQGLAAGVAYLHDHGIVHRDLKPGNLFLDQGVVKIGDYGLAKFISCSRRSGQTESVGTFHYMAPEIGRGRYGKEIDIYAMGILLYEMLTGRVPYDGESSQEIIMKHLTAEPDVTRLPMPYRHVVRRALSKDPDQRYGTVQQMLVDLQMAQGVGPGFFAPGVTPVIADAASSEDGQGDDDVEAVQESIVARVVPEKRPRPFVTPHVAGPNEAGSLNNEPIARGLQIALTRMRQQWNRASFNTPTRFCLLLAAVLLFMMNAGWLVPLAFFFGTIYAGYLLVWMLMTPAVSQPNPIMATPARPADRTRRPAGMRLSRAVFRQRPFVDRLTELFGSMLLAALVSAVLCIIMMVVGSQGLDSSFYGWAPTYVWMLLTSVIGSWIVLIHGKLFEGSDGDLVRRRFSMLVGGMGLGAVASLLWQLIFVDASIEPTYVLQSRAVTAMPDLLYRDNGTPEMLAAMGYFGGLLLLIRWWRQADPLRSTRLSMLSTIGCVLSAALMHWVLPYPRGFLIAATMSMAVQISAPWINHREREQLQNAGVPLSHV